MAPKMGHRRQEGVKGSATYLSAGFPQPNPELEQVAGRDHKTGSRGDLARDAGYGGSD